MMHVRNTTAMAQFNKSSARMCDERTIKKKRDDTSKVTPPEVTCLVSFFIHKSTKFVKIANI